MGCRVRVRIRHRDRVVETSALVNSGFETDAPDIVIPLELAKRLGLWPPRELSYTVLETGGGEVSVVYVEAAAELELVLPDRESRKYSVNVIINPHIHEVVLSDYVSTLLGIVLLNIKKGLWRLEDDPVGVVRGSEEAEEW